jgi:arylsulfatase
MEFAYDGGGLAKGGDVTLYCDGKQIGAGRVEITQPLVFSADETTDIGSDLAMPVSADYKGNDKFNGKIHVVQIDLGDDDHSHLIDLDEMVRVAMARQ